MSQSDASLSSITALLLARSEEYAVIDRRALRDAGAGTVRALTSGVYAARFLAGREKGDGGSAPDVVFVHAQLADMSGAEFVELAHSHPRLAGLPIIHVSSSNAPEDKLRALAQGYSGLLARPYSGAGMRLALEYAAAVKRDRGRLELGHALLNTALFDQALARFEDILQGCGQEADDRTPEDAFHSGLEKLRRRDWDGAIPDFQQALRRLSLRGEAEFGLALAFRGKGDSDGYRLWLERAGHSFAKAAKWRRARMAYACLLREDPRSESPFLLEAGRLIRAGEFDAAADALAEGADLGSSTAMRERLAGALIYNSEAPAEDEQALRRSLRGRAPAMAERLSEDLRVEIAGRRERIERRRAGSEKKTFGIPPLGDPEAPDGFAATAPDDPEASHDARDLNAAPRSVKPAPPLSEQSLGTSLFSGMPGVNEAVTVAKLTWKIFHSGKL